MIDPKTRKVIVLENPLLPTRVKELIARVLFDNLQVRLCRCPPPAERVVLTSLPRRSRPSVSLRPRCWHSWLPGL